MPRNPGSRYVLIGDRLGSRVWATFGFGSIATPAVVKVAASVIHCLDDLSHVHRLTDRKPHPVLLIVDEEDALQRSVEVVFETLQE